jgi:hypothetical protein
MVVANITEKAFGYCLINWNWCFNFCRTLSEAIYSVRLLRVKRILGAGFCGWFFLSFFAVEKERKLLNKSYNRFSLDNIPL